MSDSAAGGQPAASVEKPEDLIGRVFEDRDSRMGGRRIQILEAFEKRDPWDKPYPAFKVVSVGFPGNERPVGTKSSIGLEQLHKRFRPVTD